jgi:hypothetical protein
MVKRRVVWAEHELGQAKLGDKRRVARAVAVADSRQKRPGGPLTSSLGDSAGVKGGYRFYESDAIEAEALIAGHARQMEERVRGRGSGYVLSIQDTMHVESRGQDVWVHTTLVATPTREALGLLQQQVWERQTRGGTKKAHRRVLPVADKESHKWLVSIRAAGEMQKRLGEAVRVVSVGDREHDLYDAFDQAQASGVAVLVRAAQDRNIAEADDRKLWAYVLALPIAGEMTVQIGRNGQRDARHARVTVRCAPVTLRPPQRRLRSTPLADIAVTAVHVVEVHPPPGVEAIEWLLLTTLDTVTFQDACQRVSDYACRWLIELFHKILKSGCLIEKRQFEAVDTFTRYLALDSIVAWRLLFLTLQARCTPNLPCSLVFDLHQWQSLFAFTHPGQPIPDQPPRLDQATLWIAQLGGYLGRSGDGPPGILVLWRGLQRLADIADAFAIFAQGSTNVLGKG